MKNLINNPFQFILFGATGDLAALKLFPSIYDLFIQDRFPENFQIIGFGRTPLTSEEFAQKVKDSVLKKNGGEASKIDQLIPHLHYFAGQYDQVESYQELQSFCNDLAGGQKMEQIAYFSVPPSVFEDIIKNLAENFRQPDQRLKIVLEKPFGTDERSANHLFLTLSTYFEDKNIFLLDHYLGKRPIQSILKLRMENNVINMLLNGEEISNIQITAFETADVGKRVGYFDQVGIMKDMVQSHLLQVLSFITMDIPIIPSIDSIQREKNNILEAIRFSGNEQDVVFGQYKSYQEAQPNSKTDTFCALKFFIDRRQWFNVPVYIRTGKALNRNKMEVVIEFKRMPFQNETVKCNQMVFETKPGEQLRLRLVQDQEIGGVFNSSNAQIVELSESITCKNEHCLSEYGNLLMDVFLDQRIYFLSYPEISSAWRLIDQIESVRKSLEIKPEIYEDGGKGPLTHLKMPEIDKFCWNEH